MIYIDRSGDRGTIAFITLALCLLFLAAAFLYLIANSEKWLEEEPPATTTTIIITTTTGVMPTTTTTIVEYAANETNDTLEWLEKRVFDLVNYERTSRGLHGLKWDEEIAEVCRLYSKDMADNDFFSHTGSDGSNSTDRLLRGGVYYWNLTGENIAKVSIIESYLVNTRGEVVETRYKTFEQLAQDAVDGWMESPNHRANVLHSEFDEAGMGVAEFNDSYYFTENFIVRVHCGFKGGACCETSGHLPWCYTPWKCEANVCV